MSPSLSTVGALSVPVYGAFVYLAQSQVKRHANGKVRKMLDQICSRPVTMSYNAISSVFSLAMFVVMLSSVSESQKWASYDAFVCLPFKRTQAFNIVMLAFFVSKFIEWYDTLVLVVRGKPVSWLHYLHHMTTAIITGLNQDSAMASMTVLTNTFVHALMYAYYCRPWRAVRRWVTRIQIIQHAACVASGIYVLATADCRRANSTLAILAGLAGYIMYLTMFLNFYFKSRTQ